MGRSGRTAAGAGGGSPEHPRTRRERDAPRRAVGGAPAPRAWRRSVPPDRRRRDPRRDPARPRLGAIGGRRDRSSAGAHLCRRCAPGPGDRGRALHAARLLPAHPRLRGLEHHTGQSRGPVLAAAWLVALVDKRTDSASCRGTTSSWGSAPLRSGSGVTSSAVWATDTGRSGPISSGSARACSSSSSCTRRSASRSTCGCSYGSSCSAASSPVRSA